MPIYEMPRRPEPLPVAPKAMDTALCRRLVANRAELQAMVTVLVPNAAFYQQSVVRGRWCSRRSLTAIQKQSQTVLRAARAHRDLPQATLVELDLLVMFVRGIDMNTAREVAA
jgi:hypothetical protein